MRPWLGRALRDTRRTLASRSPSRASRASCTAARRSESHAPVSSPARLTLSTRSGYELEVPTWDKFKDAEDTKQAVAAGPRQPPADANRDPVLATFP